MLRISIQSTFSEIDEIERQTEEKKKMIQENDYFEDGRTVLDVTAGSEIDLHGRIFLEFLSLFFRASNTTWHAAFCIV